MPESILSLIDQSAPQLATTAAPIDAPTKFAAAHLLTTLLSQQQAASSTGGMALDILRVVQILWAVGDVLLTGGAFSLLGVYGSDQARR